MNRFQGSAMRRAVGVDRHSGRADNQDPVVQDALDTAAWLSGGAQGWLGGQGRPEADLAASYGLPVDDFDPHADERRRKPLPRSQPSRAAPDATNELMGATYGVEPADAYPYRHSGDPESQIALREPPGYQHPLDFLDIIIGGAPRMMPVSQAIHYGAEPSRSDEFESGMTDAVVRGVVNGVVGFRDRRYHGRRYRATNNQDEFNGRQEPYPKDPPISDEAWGRGF